MSRLPEPQFVARLKRLGGIPDAILADQEMMGLFLPILRADITIGETPSAEEAPLDCPISVFGGENDERASRVELEAWRDQTRGSFSIEVFPGGHFFLQTHRSELLASISRTPALRP